MLLSDQDTRESIGLGMKQEMIQIATQFGEACRLHGAGNPEDGAGGDRAIPG